MSILTPSDEVLKKVAELVVYGSFLRDEHRLGDVDIAYKLDWKQKPSHDEEWHRKLAEHWRKSARQFNEPFADLFWPETQVRLFLKNRKRTISLHDMDEFIWMPKDDKFSYRVLLGDAAAIEQRLREAALKNKKEGEQ